MSIVYGINPVLEALKSSGSRIERICVERGQGNPRIREIIELGRRKQVPLSFEERAWLDRRSEGERHQGVLCYLSEMGTLSAEEIIDQAADPGLVLVLDGIEDPRNLGAILRSAEVAAADGVFIPRRRSSGLTPVAVKSSAGAAAHVKVSRVVNIARLLDLLRDRGYWIAGIDEKAGRPLWEADFRVAMALVLGNEGSGLHRLVQEKCDYLAGIPVRGTLRSYNVSVAAGIVLYEVLRQRHTREAFRR